MGDWVKMCMQCGVCAGSCPLGPHWEHSPQKIFMMIRAGKREEVLTSDSMWMCTVLLQLHGALPEEAADHADHARHRRIRAPPGPGAEGAADARFLSGLFWNNIAKTGRVNELKLPMGLVLQGRARRQGIKQAWR